jgi:hypothetical protein
MTLKTTKNLIAICEYMSTPGAKLSKAMAVIGGSEKSHHIFSLLNSDDLLVNWPDENEYIPFAQAIDAAKHIRLAYWYDQLMREVAQGTEEQVIFNGEQQWAKDPEVLALLGPNPSPIDCYVFFGRHDPFLRRPNASGSGNLELVPLTVTRSASAHLKIHMARSLFPDLNPEARSSVTSENSSMISMLVVGRDRDKPEDQMTPTELRASLQRRLHALDAAAPRPAALRIEPPEAPPEEPTPPPRRPQPRPSINVDVQPDPSRGYRTR